MTLRNPNRPYDTYTAVVTKEDFFRRFKCCETCLVSSRCLQMICLELNDFYNIAVLRPCEEFYKLDLGVMLGDINNVGSRM